MRLKSFFKLLNRKIRKYDNVATNPFGTMPLQSITLVWVEEVKPKISQDIKH